MAEHISPGLARPTDPLAGTKPRPGAAPPSSHGAAECSSISIIRSPTNSIMSNISEGEEDEEASLSISSASITTSSMLQEASFCSNTSSSSSSSSNVGGGQTDDSAVHRSNHDSTGDDTSHGIAHGTGAGGSGGSDGERNSSGSMATRSNQEGDMSSVPSPSSSPRGLRKEDDEVSSDGHEDDEGEEEGGGAETAVDKVVELLKQGQEAQQKIAEGVVQQGQTIQRLGRKMVQDAQLALQEGQQEHVVTTGRVKQMLGYLVYRLKMCQDEKRALSLQKGQLRAKLEANQKNDITVKAFSTRLDRIQHNLNEEEKQHADLRREFTRLTVVKEGLEKANRGLRADVAYLDAAQKKWENNSPVKVAEVYAQLKALQANQEKLVTQNVSLCADKDRLTEANHRLMADVAYLDAAQKRWEDNSPVKVAEVHTQLLALEANQEKLVTQNVSLCADKDRHAETNRGLEAEVARLKKKLATTTIVVDTSLAVSEAATAATGLGGTSMEAPASVGPVVSRDPVLSPSPASTAPTAAKDENEHKVKVKAASPSPAKTPSRPRVEATRPSSPLAAICPASKVAPSPAAVATTGLKQQQTPSKARKSAGGEEDMSKCPFFNLYSPLVEKELNKVHGTPRQYSRRPLAALSLNSAGKGAAEGKAPMMAALTKAAPKRGGSMVKDMPLLVKRAMAKPVLNRGSIGKDVPLLDAKVVTKPAPKRISVSQEGSLLDAKGSTGSADKQGSAAKGPSVKVSRAGGARTERLAKAKGVGDGGKVGVEASGRVLRSASRAAAAAAAESAAAAAVHGPSAVQHTRSTRSTTRRPAPKTTATGRGVNSRGKYMSF